MGSFEESLNGRPDVAIKQLSGPLTVQTHAAIIAGTVGVHACTGAIGVAAANGVVVGIGLVVAIKGVAPVVIGTEDVARLKNSKEK